MTVLLVDSDRSLLLETAAYLESMDVRAVTAGNIDEAVKEIRTQLFDVIIIDVCGQNGNIAKLIDVQQTFNRNAPVLVTADFAHVHEAVRAVKMGAHNFVQKPYDSEDLLQKILKAIEFRRLELEAQCLRGERNLIYKPENFVSESPEMEKVLQMIRKVARTDSTVLLTGETGTGKELVSGAIHYNSDRADKAFVKVNCAALPTQLLESELFGHEKGAFTGADKLRIGRFEQANEGSILLDEIAELDFSTQVKLLRVLQEKVFERLGSNRPIKLNVRVMTATNRDLYTEVQENRFREDLYYRLNVVNIHIPPLRERRSDILPLARYFLTRFSGEMGKEVTNFDPDATREILNYSWPGNVRELRNTIERAVLMTDHQEISVEDLNLAQRPGSQSQTGAGGPAARGGSAGAGGPTGARESAGTGGPGSGAENPGRTPQQTEWRIDRGGTGTGSGTGSSRPGSEAPPEEVRFVRIPREGLSLKELEEDLIRQALEAAHYVQKDAAKLLRISPRALNYKIAKYGITNPHWHKNT